MLQNYRSTAADSLAGPSPLSFCRRSLSLAWQLSYKADYNAPATEGNFLGIHHQLQLILNLPSVNQASTRAFHNYPSGYRDTITSHVFRLQFRRIVRLYGQFVLHYGQYVPQRGL